MIKQPTSISKEADGSCKEGYIMCGDGCIDGDKFGMKYKSCGSKCISNFEEWADRYIGFDIKKIRTPRILLWKYAHFILHQDILEFILFWKCSVNFTNT
jgi:hypothetical protein